MKNKLKPFTLMILLSFTTGLHAVAPSVSDFLTPAQDGDKAPAKPKQPDKLKKAKQTLNKEVGKTTVVEAADIQDAVLAAAMELEKGDDEIVMLKVPGGGMGVMASGTATYRASPNRNTSLILKRKAYMNAYLNAKKNLSGFLHGMSVEGKETLSEAMDTYDDDHKSLVNTRGVLNETIANKIEGLLRGFVIYSVEDNVKESEVIVKIVSTPMTRGKTMQATSSVVVAESYQAGLKRVKTELRAKVVPPVCGRVICVMDEKGNQDLYFVGFGSEVIRAHSNKAIAKRLKQTALQRTKMRASVSLLAIMNGQKSMWIGGMSDDTREKYKEFDLKNDPTLENRKSVVATDKTFESFRSQTMTKDYYKFSTKGKIPPGMVSETWYSKDGDWVFVASIYNPKMTLLASGKVTVNIKPAKLLPPAKAPVDDGTPGIK